MSKFADQFKLPPGGAHDYFNDPTDLLANDRGMVLDFYHVPSGISVAFKGMINSFSDQYSSEWNTETVYGRMDPIPAFQGTARTISVEWDVVAASIAESKLNMAKCETLMAMLYPTYESMGNSNTIASSPIFKFKFGNFAQNAIAAGGARASEAGLVGFIGGFTFEPDFESGIIDNPDSKDYGTFYPQRMTLSAEFTVLHTHDLGWKKGGAKPSWAEGQPGATGAGQATPGFPYSTKGSHLPGFEGYSGAHAAGASGTRTKTRESAETEGTDPADDMAVATAYDLGLG